MKNDMSGTAWPPPPPPMNGGVKMPDALAAAVSFALPSPKLFFGAHGHRGSVLSVQPLVMFRRSLTLTLAEAYVLGSQSRIRSNSCPG